MHKLALHIRLTNYISKLDLASKTEIEDGYYKFMIQLKVDTKADIVHIKHSSFEKYLGDLADVEVIEEAEFTEVEEKKPSIKKTVTTTETTEYKALSYLEIIGWGALIIYILRNLYYGY